MGTLILLSDCKLGMKKGSLIIRPNLTRNGMRKSETMIQSWEEEMEKRAVQFFEEESVPPKESQRNLYQMSLKNLHAIYSVDAAVGFSAESINSLSDQLIPFYMIREGNLQFMIAPLGQHGTASVRIAQFAAPAQIKSEQLRHYAKTLLKGLNVHYGVDTRQILNRLDIGKETIRRLQTAKLLPFASNLTNVEDTIVRWTNGQNSDLDMEKTIRNYRQTKIRRTLHSMLGAAVRFHTYLVGLLPLGKGPSNSLLEDIMSEIEIPFIDVVLKKTLDPTASYRQQLLDVLPAFFEKMEAFRLPQRIQRGAATFAKACLEERQLQRPGLVQLPTKAWR